MAASFQKDSFIGWTRFRHGDFQCTVVTDGPLKMGPPEGAFPKADPKEIAELLSRAFLPTDSVTLNQNLLIVNTGEDLVLFDPGCGVNQSFGKSSFGPDLNREIAKITKDLPWDHIVESWPVAYPPFETSVTFC